MIFRGEAFMIYLIIAYFIYSLADIRFVICLSKYNAIGKL